MMFSNIPKEHARYISQQVLFEHFFGERSLEEVTRKGFIKLIKVKTRKLQWQEGRLLIAFFMFSGLPIIDYIRTERFTDFSMFSIAISVAMVIFWLAIKTKRIDFDVASLIPKMKHPEKFKTFLEYQAAFNQSGLPLLRLTAWGYWNSGYLHKADNGILALLGKPKDRAAIRRLSFGWGNFLYPHPDLLMGDKPDTESKQEIQTSTLANFKNIETLLLNIAPQSQLYRLILTMRNLVDRDKHEVHRGWFEILLSTACFYREKNKKLRHELVLSHLEKRNITVRSQEVCKRIAKSQSYPELEKWLPFYLKLAANSGNGNAKALLLELPEEVSAPS